MARDKSKSGPIHWKGGGYNKTRQMEITPMWALNQAAQNMDRFGTSDLGLIQLLLAEDARKTLESQAAGNPFTKENERSSIIQQARQNVKRGGGEEYGKLQDNLNELGEAGRLSNEDFAMEIQKNFMRPDDFDNVTERRTTGGTQKERQEAKDEGVNVQEIQRRKEEDNKQQDNTNTKKDKPLYQQEDNVVSSSNIQNETNTIDTNFEIADTDYTFSSFDENFNNDDDLINQIKDDLNEDLQWYVDVVDNLGGSPRPNSGGSPRPSFDRNAVGASAPS